MTKKDSTATIQMHVTIEVSPSPGQSLEDAATEFTDIFKEYLTETSHPFREDYGHGAWGGYEGPFVESVSVTEVSTNG